MKGVSHFNGGGGGGSFSNGGASFLSGGNASWVALVLMGRGGGFEKITRLGPPPYVSPPNYGKPCLNTFQKPRSCFLLLAFTCCEC